MTPLDGRGLDRLCAERQVVVCVGAGGVGKTTTSAALALAAARRGRRVLVCTIDPARRLAASLGLGAFRSEEVAVSPAVLERAGVPLPPGASLHAMMLDTKRTFDRLVQRYARDPEAVQRILTNPIYERLSSQLAGSQEYMAMEKLYELHHSRRFDLVVLDTPPTRHALDFLEAPERLSRFFDVSVVRWFVAPFRDDGGRRGVAGRMAERVVGWLAGIFGAELLRQLGEFFAALETLWGGFRQRAQRVKALLADGSVSAFVIVSSAAPHAVQEAVYFARELEQHRMPLAGIVANRVHRFVTSAGAAEAEPPPLERLLAALGARLGPEALAGEDGALFEQAFEILVELAALARADARHLGPLRSLARERDLIYREIPALETDVHSIEGLARLDRHLNDTAPEPVEVA